MAEARRVLLFPVAALICGCGGARAPTPEEEEVALSPAGAPEDQVVARVNSAPLLASDVALQMQSGEDRRQALQSQIRLELLAQEAHRRGLDSDPSAREAQHRAMVTLLLRRQFKEEYTAQSIPRELVETAYKLNRSLYVHPELVRVTHVLVGASPDQPPEHHERALAIARKVHGMAVSRPLSRQEFADLVARVMAGAPGLRVKAESLRTPRRGYTVDAFADAAFALEKPGQVSPVVTSRFGYHVIYLEERTPERATSLAEAEPEIRGRILEEARTLALNKLGEELEKRYGVTTYPERLPSPQRGPRETP